MECSRVLQTTLFAYWNGLGTSDALLCESHTLQSGLESGQEAGNGHIDFSAAFNMVNYQGILYTLCSVCIRDSVLSIPTQFLSIRSLHVRVDGCGVNLLALCEECRRAVFWARYCSSCMLLIFFLFWKLN